MNWGYKIIFGFILFATFVFTLVFKMINSGNDLVKTKYFKTGLQVNEELKLHQSSSDLENGISIQVQDPKYHTIVLKFDSLETNLEGEIELICLSADKADQIVPLDLENSGGKWHQTIPLKSWKPGKWLCEVRGNREGKAFLVKTSFKI